MRVRCWCPSTFGLPDVHSKGRSVGVLHWTLCAWHCTACLACMLCAHTFRCSLPALTMLPSAVNIAAIISVWADARASNTPFWKSQRHNCPGKRTACGSRASVPNARDSTGTLAKAPSTAQAQKPIVRLLMAWRIKGGAGSRSHTAGTFFKEICCQNNPLGKIRLLLTDEISWEQCF